MSPSWGVVYDDDLYEELRRLPKDVQKSIAKIVGLLVEEGPLLGRPHADTIHGAPLGNLKELRVQHAGQPWRVLYAFDRERRAVLLALGNKGGWNDPRWYDVHIRIAVERSKRHNFQQPDSRSHGTHTRRSP